MIVTTYSCDKCRHKQEDRSNPRQLWEIGVIIQDIGAFSRGGFQDIKHKSIWCRECIVDSGLQPPKKDEPTPKPITLEDIVREIIQEGIEASQ